MFRRVGDEQVYVFSLAIHLDKLRLEVGANLLEDGPKPIDSISVEHLSSIFGDKDQVDMQCEHTMSPVTNIT